MNGKTIAAMVAVVVVAGICLFVWLTSGYGEVSAKAYQFATASYGACMARSPERIVKLEALLTSEGFRNELSNQEVRWCEDILDDAQNEDWARAANAAKQMMEDQVKH